MQTLCILAAFVFALWGLWLANLSLPLSLAFGFALFVSALQQLMLIRGLLPQSIQALRCTGKDWWLTLASGTTVRAELVGLRIVLPWLVSINFRTARGNHHCVVVKDQVSQTEHRRLRAAILLQPVKRSAMARLWRLAVTRWHQYRIYWIRRLGRIVQGVM
ncbi:MAG: protein YgfX [Pseudomonadales bacterium]